MSAVTFTGCPNVVLDAVRARCNELGLSRSEYLRRMMAQDWVIERVTVTVDDLERFTTTYGQCGDRACREDQWTTLRG